MLFLLNNWRVIVVLGLLVSLAGIVAGAVYKVKAWGANEVRQEWAAKDAADKESARLKSFAAATGLQADRARARTIIQERTVYVDREIVKLVESGACIKPAGVVCINSAIAGKKCGPEPDASVPAVKPAR